MRLSFDPEDPPAEPPVECVSPTIWRWSHRLHRRHPLADDGRCACGEPFPCQARRLVERGFLAALGSGVGVGRADLLDRLIAQSVRTDPSDPRHHRSGRPSKEET